MQTTPAVRCAVIGTGHIAREHIPVLQALPEAELVALCDINANAVADASKEFGVAQTFTSLDDLESWGEFDAVYVAVSVLAVAEVAERFIRSGTATFMEKPPGLYSSDTVRLADAVRETGTIAAVGFNRRHYSSTLAGRQALLETGDIVSVTVHADEIGVLLREEQGYGKNFRSDATQKFPPEVAARWMYANSVHGLDLLRFFGGDVAKVIPVRQQYVMPIPDSFSALLEYKSGAVGRAIADHFAPPGTGIAPNGHRYQVRTRNATLTSGSSENPTLAGATLVRHGHEPVEFSLTGLDRRLKPGFPGESRAFLQAVQTGNPVSFPSATLDDAVGTMQMLDAITGAEDWSPQASPFSGPETGAPIQD